MQNKHMPDPDLGSVFLQNEGAVESNERVLYLEKRIKALGEICQELNPYQPLSTEFKIKLKEFNIHEFEDPFKITNALLILLEDSIDELHIYKPVPDSEKFR